MDYISSLKRAMEDIVRRETAWPGHMCIYCESFFLTPNFLETHQRNVHCGSQSQTVEEYIVQSETPTGWWMCTTCGVDFPTLEILESHQRNVHCGSLSQTVEEDIIQSEMPNPQEELSNPRSEMVEPYASQSGTQRPFTCSFCEETYKIYGEQMGMGGLCKYCMLIFPTLDIMEKHTRDVQRLGQLQRKKHHDSLTPNPKEEMSEMVEPNASESAMEKTYLCFFCSIFIESRSAYKEHIVNKHREESGMQKPSPCVFCNMVFESSESFGEHLMMVHLEDMKRDNEMRWEKEKGRNEEMRKQAYQSYAAAAQSLNSNQDIMSPPSKKPSSLDGLRHLTVDDLANLELSDLAYIRYGSVPCTRNDRDIVPMEEIEALEATHVIYGSVIEAGVCGKSPYTREVILCRTCGSRMIKDSALRDICLKGCPPGCASRSFLVGPSVTIHYPPLSAITGS